MLWLVQGSVFILATLLVEAGSWRRLVCWWRRGQREADTGDTEDKDLDEDVVKERLRVLSGKDADVLQVKNLFKRQVFIVAKKATSFKRLFMARQVPEECQASRGPPHVRGAEGRVLRLAG